MSKPAHKLAPLFSSAKEDWETPQDLFDKLNAEFGPFDLDAAASGQNTKCKLFFDVGCSGLEQDWVVKDTWIEDDPFSYSARARSTIRPAKVWVNPPYGRGVTGKWVKKAYEESQKGCLVVMLLPARTDTAWFHTWILDRPGVVVRFLKGRLKFGGAKHGAPFPSMVVIFRPPQEIK